MISALFLGRNLQKILPNHYNFNWKYYCWRTKGDKKLGFGESKRGALDVTQFPPSQNLYCKYIECTQKNGTFLFSKYVYKSNCIFHFILLIYFSDTYGLRFFEKNLIIQNILFGTKNISKHQQLWKKRYYKTRKFT